MSKIKGCTDDIVRLLNEGYKPGDVAEITGCNISNVYATGKRYGVKFGGMKSALDGREDEIIQLLKEGYTIRYIADVLNINFETLKRFKRMRGIKVSDFRSTTPQPYTDDEVRRKIQQADNGLEYVSGYETWKSVIIVRCKTCGGEFRRRYDNATRSNATCPICAERRRFAQAEKRKNQQKRKKELAKQEYLKKRAELECKKEEYREQRKREREHECPVCGTMTSRPRYCSDKCAGKAESKRREISRRARMQSQMIDKDITLESLFKRDRGICHICGIECNYEDYTMVGTTHIAGNWYPSIDHVKPLSKGGAHSWKNVKLAHRICNSLKRDA